jgi:hypothetical protein
VPPLPPVNWSLALAKKLAKWHKERKLKLIERKDNYKIATEAEHTRSFKDYKRFISNSTILEWLSTGLTLRLMEPDEVRRKDIQYIRDNLSATQGTRALRVAELAQSAALDAVLGLVDAGQVRMPPTISFDTVLGDIDRYAIFVREEDDVKKKAEEADVRALGSAPFFFVVLGYGSARPKAASVFRSIREALQQRGYSLVQIIDDSKAIGIFYKS